MRKKYYCKDCNKQVSDKRYKRCQSCANKISSTGRNVSNKTKQKMRKKRIRWYKNNPNFNKGLNHPMFGKKRSKHSKNLIKLWKNKEFRNKIIKAQFKSRKITPNKIEEKLNKLLQTILFNKYRFVGNGKVILNGFCPDFINVNGQKKIIELYGDYWHNLPSWKERDKRRLLAYKNLGFKTLVIWEHEFEKVNKLKSKILKFNKQGGK